MTYFSQQIPALIFAAGLGAMTASPAFAQDGCGAKMHETHHHGKQMEQRHQQLHQALKLTAEQQPAWKQLMDSEKSPREASESKPAELTKLSMPERAERKLARAKAELERQTNHVAALKALYQILTPEQKHTFEEFHTKPAHGMHGKAEHRSKHKSANKTEQAPTIPNTGSSPHH